MDLKKIAVIALSNEDFESLGHKLAEAARWVELAAQQGADLVVLPETINLYCGDGPENPRAQPLEAAALDDWQTSTAPLLDTAKQAGVAVALPLLVRESGRLYNSCFFISHTGEVAGRYDKNNPTPDELKAGIVPGKPTITQWQGLRVGCAICFDIDFAEVFEQQAAMGTQLFIVPSLQPGRWRLNRYAHELGIPIALAYPAWSRIIQYDGRELTAGGYRNETLRYGFGSPIQIATINFDYAILHAEHNQQKMVDVQRAFGKRIAIHFDQGSTLFYLESLDEDLPIADVMKQFELVSMNDFYREYRQTRAQYVRESS